MRRKQFNRKLLTGALLGTLAGISVMMFDKSVRRTVVDKSKQYSQKTKRWVNSVRENPRGFVNNVKHGLEQVTISMKEVSHELQEIVEQIEEVKETSTKIIRSAKGASEDIKEVGSTLFQVQDDAKGEYADRKRDDNHKLH